MLLNFGEQLSFWAWVELGPVYRLEPELAKRSRMNLWRHYKIEERRTRLIVHLPTPLLYLLLLSITLENVMKTALSNYLVLFSYKIVHPLPDMELELSYESAGNESLKSLDLFEEEGVESMKPPAGRMAH